MTEIFISYRREDSAPYAGRINDRLCAVYGKEHVFMDVEDIALGQNFTTVLREKLDASQVTLVLIGSKWLSAQGADGGLRLDDAHDFVRFEIAEALRLNKRVIPILLNDTPMPKDSELPIDLQPLTFCQALQISDGRFERDLADLIQGLGNAPEIASSRQRRQLMIGVGIATVIVAAIVVAYSGWHRLNPPLAAPQQANADIGGTWQGEVVYEWDQSKYAERFSFKFIGGTWTGSASFLGVPRGILSLQLKGKMIAFETHSKGSIGEKEIDYVHLYRGEVQGETMHLVMQTTGGYDAAVPREIIAKRISPAIDHD